MSGTPSDETVNDENVPVGQDENAGKDFRSRDAQLLPVGTANTGNNANQMTSFKMHGYSAPGQHLTSGLNYYTLYSTQDLTPTGQPVMVIPRGTPLGVYSDVVENSQYIFDKIVETISLRAQPVMISQITSVPYNQFTALPDFAPTAGNVFAMGFVIEHNGAWDTNQAGYIASTNPVGVTPRPLITGGPLYNAAIPTMLQTIVANLNNFSPAFVNTGNAGAATNTFTVVSMGPF
jgi:hypothetical protein